MHWKIRHQKGRNAALSTALSRTRLMSVESAPRGGSRRLVIALKPGKSFQQVFPGGSAAYRSGAQDENRAVTAGSLSLNSKSLGMASFLSLLSSF